MPIKILPYKKKENMNSKTITIKINHATESSFEKLLQEITEQLKQGYGTGAKVYYGDEGWYFETQNEEI